MIKRCKWCNLNNPLYVKYHDEEWGIPRYDDQYLYEMFILECFQAGLSWECILNKREHFRKAYDNFDLNKVIEYDEQKLQALYQNKDIIRHKSKIIASIENSKIFKQIITEYGSFYTYIKSFSETPIYEVNQTTNYLSDTISKDFKQRGMKFVGSITIYSYLQAIGIIYSHDEDCYLYRRH